MCLSDLSDSVFVGVKIGVDAPGVLAALRPWILIGLFDWFIWLTSLASEQRCVYYAVCLVSNLIDCIGRHFVEFGLWNVWSWWFWTLLRNPDLTMDRLTDRQAVTPAWGFRDDACSSPDAGVDADVSVDAGVQRQVKRHWHTPSQKSNSGHGPIREWPTQYLSIYKKHIDANFYMYVHYVHSHTHRPTCVCSHMFTP